MPWRPAMSLALFSICLVVLSGCGHSEEEWQAKVKESQQLQSQLAAEKAAHQKTDADLSDATRQIDALKGQFKKAGVDLSNMNSTLAGKRMPSPSSARTRNSSSRSADDSIF